MKLILIFGVSVVLLAGGAIVYIDPTFSGVFVAACMACTSGGLMLAAATMGGVIIADRLCTFVTRFFSRDPSKE